MPDQLTWISLFQIPLVLGIVWLFSRPLSAYMAQVALQLDTPFDKALSPLANWFYSWIGIKPEQEQRWQTYALSAVCLNVAGALFLITLQMTQGFLFHKPGVGFIQSLNTAISFVTNTNWQSYTPESTLENVIQTVGLSAQMFLSAGTALAVALAVMRAFMDHRPSTHNNNAKSNGTKSNGASTIGNFWVDCTRMILWVLVPLSFLLALIFIGFGMTQALYEAIASQEAIKFLGTNGGGFFKANSAHPLECPSAFCGLIEIGAMLLIVFSLPKTFGQMVGDPAQGKALLKAMMILFLSSLGLALFAQWQATRSLGPILEGMEMHFDWIETIFFNVTSTTTGTGATNAALSSLPPLTGLVLLSNILSGAVIFGGIGNGLYKMILYAILTVFLAGLMVGRTPEYLGKKIETFEMKMVVAALIIPAIFTLLFTTFAALYAPDGALNPGPHGLTEILYAYSSTTYNNGSSFAGLKSDMTFYQLTTALTMTIGRYVVMIAALALAGSLSQKPKIPSTAATFPTTGGLFIGLLISVILATSILIFFPIFSLGPLAEQVSQWHIPPRL